MNDTARNVMWVGIFLVTMIIFVHWSEWKTLLFTGGSSSPSSSSVFKLNNPAFGPTLPGGAPNPGFFFPFLVPPLFLLSTPAPHRARVA